MRKISKINLNLALEKIYMEGLVNSLYTDISNYGNEAEDLSLLIKENHEKENIIYNCRCSCRHRYRYLQLGRRQKNQPAEEKESD